MDADVVGPIEIENNVSAATQDLVDVLNTVLGAGTYTFIDTSTIGSDAIKVALLYKPGLVAHMLSSIIRLTQPSWMPRTDPSWRRPLKHPLE
jgi:predicted extracellular nuclease